MYNKQFVELVNKRIDGILSAAEEKQLQSYLQHNKSNRDYAADLERSMDLLKHLREVDPPEALKKNVMAGIDLQLYSKKSFVKSINPWWQDWLPSPRISLAFTSGLLLGILMLTFYINDNPARPLDIYGTMGLTSANSAVLTEQLMLDKARLKGSIQVSESTQLLLLESHLFTDAKERQIQISYNPQELVFAAHKNSGQSIQLENKNGLLVIHGDADAQLIFYKLTTTAAMVEINIDVAGERISSNQITINDKN